LADRKAQRLNKVRIIAGQWRGRKISFLDAPGLRPTPDRVRETVFNWLQNKIPDAVCVDCFAGSGALGFEAASRGAKEVYLVESNQDVVHQLQENKKVLNAEAVEIIASSADTFLQQFNRQVDIFFLDPPFSSNLLQQTLGLIIGSDLLQPEGVIYLEHGKDNIPKLPDAYSWFRQKQTGDVGYGLVGRK